jgi:hypothetical protein
VVPTKLRNQRDRRNATTDFILLYILAARRGLTDTLPVRDDHIPVARVLSPRSAMRR